MRCIKVRFKLNYFKRFCPSAKKNIIGNIDSYSHQDQNLFSDTEYIYYMVNQRVGTLTYSSVAEDSYFACRAR